MVAPKISSEAISMSGVAVKAKTRNKKAVKQQKLVTGDVSNASAVVSAIESKPSVNALPTFIEFSELATAAEESSEVQESSEGVTVAPFELLQNKVNSGIVTSERVLFPMQAGDNNSIKFFESSTSYNIRQIGAQGFFCLFSSKLSKEQKGKGGRFSSKAFGDALETGIQSFTDLCNEAHTVTKQNFDREAIILRIANGVFDNGKFENEIVGALQYYNEMRNSDLVSLIQDAGFGNIVAFSYNTVHALNIYFKLGDNNETGSEDFEIIGKIENGTSGRIALRFNAIFKGCKEYEFELPVKSEDGDWVYVSGRARHLGWLENGIQKLTETVESISNIDYLQVLKGLNAHNILSAFETIRTRLINDDKKPMDSEKSEIVLAILKDRCSVNEYRTGLQVVEEASSMLRNHGNAKYLKPMLDGVLKSIFS